MHPFRNLLLISVGRADSFEKDPTPQVWGRMFDMARHQTMLAILYEGILRLPEHQLPPADLLAKWKELTELTADIYRCHQEHIEQLEPILEQMGLRGCILKGTGLSRLYPIPERRLCGDIDLWVEGTTKNTVRAFEKAGYPLHDIIYQEAKADMFDDTELEIHFHPCKMNNPFRNARLQKFFRDNAPFDGTLSYPDSRFNAVFCIAHMYRHYLVGGIGMRQMLDYYYVLRDLRPQDRAQALDTVKRLGMKRFAAAVMCAVQFNFGLEDEYLLCPPDKKLGGRLVNDIISMGNFGILDDRNYAAEDESHWQAFKRKNSRIFSNFKHFPCEVIWSPFARISQFIWRRFNGYL